MAAPTHIIPAGTLRDLVSAIFRGVGCDKAEAARIAFYLVSANLTGHDSHGVIRVPRYVDDVRAGRTLVGQSIDIVSESPTHAVVDGQYGFGQTIAPQAVDLGIRKAREAGLSVIALRRSAHAGRIGDWGERAAEAGLISLHFVNVENGELVAPYGGTARRFATNPVCIGIPPMPGRPMLLLDFATSVVAEGKVLVASNGGKPVPEGALIGADGRLSTDPATLYGSLEPNGPRKPENGTGAIRAFGEHKGSGLAFMCEILAGVLCGGGPSGPRHGPERRIGNGMLSIYLDPQHFGARDFVAETIAYAEYVKSSSPADGFAEVLLPGEPEARTRAEREARGVPLQIDTWTNLCWIATALGVPVID
ncbi:Hydroxycarboxylate dehydrogenase B [Rhodovastum atsumiense]|uniref:Malate/lactate/ureidoglycolate dehydrogenase n=1 Tax=Rhodovastum atsumiense TaxID=504468 RepID=A0A5M6IU71_9PROT|nr:malate/lactate/ureidoglycolate dehydrogenase [Rhodovastum atsumiense]KAA5611088.1 malate/lactate/ureidoglycolate dehydrogenase [Rhodovastum atsumiense]CAH2599148.1 Hydroxycarboxylate dehydrogenase B [Rhodovastum atsumiense]